jgi:hypothetical protein
MSAQKSIGLEQCRDGISIAASAAMFTVCLLASSFDIKRSLPRLKETVTKFKISTTLSS